MAKMLCLNSFDSVGLRPRQKMLQQRAVKHYLGHDEKFF